MSYLRPFSRDFLRFLMCVLPLAVFLTATHFSFSIVSSACLSINTILVLLTPSRPDNPKAPDLTLLLLATVQNQVFMMVVGHYYLCLERLVYPPISALFVYSILHNFARFLCEEGGMASEDMGWLNWFWRLREASPRYMFRITKLLCCVQPSSPSSAVDTKAPVGGDFQIKLLGPSDSYSLAEKGLS